MGHQHPEVAQQSRSNSDLYAVKDLIFGGDSSCWLFVLFATC